MDEHAADEVWHRALDFDAWPVLARAGDRALRDVQTFHGSVMNGGLLNAIQSYSDDDEFPLLRVVESSESLELPALAANIRQGLDAAGILDEGDDTGWDQLESTLDAAYDLDDDDVQRALRHALDARPAEFEPVL